MPNVTNVSSINKSNAVYTPRILRKVLRIAARAAYRCSLVCGLVAASGALSIAAAAAKSVDAVPRANNDSVSSTGTAFTINPLANDTGLANTPVTVSLIARPSHGQAGVLTGNIILYAPTSGFAGSDSFTYRLKDADGDIATATVSIKVTCATCPSLSSQSLKLSWKPATGGILGYYVYYGATASNVANYASTIPGTSTSFTTTAKDLNLQTGAQVCFRVRAYNTVGVSAYSAAACRII